MRRALCLLILLVLFAFLPSPTLVLRHIKGFLVLRRTTYPLLESTAASRDLHTSQKKINREWVSREGERNSVNARRGFGRGLRTANAQLRVRRS